MPSWACTNMQIIVAASTCILNIRAGKHMSSLEGVHEEETLFFCLYTAHLQETFDSIEGGDPAVGWVI